MRECLLHICKNTCVEHKIACPPHQQCGHLDLVRLFCHALKFCGGDMTRSRRNIGNKVSNRTPASRTGIWRVISRTNVARNATSGRNCSNKERLCRRTNGITQERRIRYSDETWHTCRWNVCSGVEQHKFFHTLFILRCPPQRNRTTPVMSNQSDWPMNICRVNQCIKVFNALGQCSCTNRATRKTHAQLINRNHAIVLA